MGTPRRLAVRVLSVLAVAAAVVLLPAGAASAHVDVDKATPDLGEVVPSPPESVTLRMSGPPGNIEVKLYHRDGRPVPLTGSGALIDGDTVTVTPPALDVGTYVLTWSSIGPDGHPAVGQTHFSVGAADGEPGDFASQAADSSALSVGLQWSVYTALAAVLGAAWLLLAGFATPAARRLARWAAVVLSLLEAARFTTIVLAVGDGAPLEGARIVLTTWPTAAGWAVVALACAVMVLVRAPVLVLVAACVGATADVLTGHLGSDSQWMALVPLAAVHLVAVMLWLGAPLALLAAGPRDRATVARFAARFTPWALGALVAVAASGVALVAMRTGLDAVTSYVSYKYGQTLLAKWGLLVLLVLPLGAYHLARTLLAKAREYQERLDTTTRQAEVGDPEVAASAAEPAERSGFRTGLAPVTVALEVAVLCVVVALGASLASLPPRVSGAVAAPGQPSGDLLSAPASMEECTTGQGGADQLLCLTRYFQGVADNEGMNVALKEVSDRWRRGDEWIQKNCHAIGHKLGRQGYRMFQDIEKAFAQGSDPCDYGYLHGVIEGASAEFTDDQLRAAMTTMCEPVGDLTLHTYRQCIHGLGHAAARRVNNDLARGMAFCDVFYKEGMNLSDPDKLSPEELRFSLCVTGVSMEWNTQPKALDAMKLPIGAPGTLMDECIKLAEQFQHGCVEYATSSMGGILERELQARDWCDKNLKDPLACYMSIGRDVVWSPSITPQQAVEVCTGGRPGRYAEVCLTRALGSVATIALDASAIDEWCPNLPENYRYLCPIVRDAMAVQIEQTTRGFITGGPSPQDAPPAPTPTAATGLPQE